MTGIITKRPWLLVVFAFLALIAAWTALIVIAEKNKPESIPVQGPASVR